MKVFIPKQKVFCFFLFLVSFIFAVVNIPLTFKNYEFFYSLEPVIFWSLYTLFTIGFFFIVKFFMKMVQKIDCSQSKLIYVKMFFIGYWLGFVILVMNSLILVVFDKYLSTM